MIPIIYFTGLLLITLATGTLAFALDWLMLRLAFHLMRPAGALQPAPARSTSAPARGTQIRR